VDADLVVDSRTDFLPEGCKSPLLPCGGISSSKVAASVLEGWPHMSVEGWPAVDNTRVAATFHAHTAGR